MKKVAKLSLAVAVAAMLATGCASRKAKLPSTPSRPAKEKVVREEVVQGKVAKETVAEKKEFKGYRHLSAGEVREFVARLNLSDQGMVSWLQMREPLERSLEYVSKKPQDGIALESYGFEVTWKELGATLRHLLRLLPRLDAEPELLEAEFLWYELAPEPLMTGYYAPEIEASLTPDPAYPYPIYGLPGDLQSVSLEEFHPRWKGQKLYYRIEGGKVIPYFDREAIELNGALAGKGLEIAWAKHPWDIYHLQVQGSGYLHLPDGSRRYILYAGKNGREFNSSAKYMLENGLIDRGALDRDGIRDALDRLGPQKHEILAKNPSYVFFRLADSPPVGTIGKPLTGMVSLATDPKFLPLGGVIPFTVELPTIPGGPQKRVWGLGLAQDTGGVIKGHRIDYYCGAGPAKEYVAFHIKTPVKACLMLSRLALAEEK